MTPLIVIAAMAMMIVGTASAQPTQDKVARRIGDPAGTGRWPAVAECFADAPGYTLYRPATWPRGRLPLVLWGNGGCSSRGAPLAITI
jgi:hypothetical protein